MTTAKKDFCFGDHAPKFDSHIRASIPGYKDGLLPASISLSRRFLQPETRVIDIGCSTGHLLASIRKANQVARPGIQYIGIDIEPSFKVHWERLKARNLGYEVADARTFRYSDLSMVISHFTIQFIRPADKLPLLQRIYDGMVEGGAMFVAEKTLAVSARLQDALAFPYYDHKLRQGFSEKDILDKERSLRGKMTLWTEAELKQALRQVGFREIEPIWRNFAFVGLLALK